MTTERILRLILTKVHGIAVAQEKQRLQFDELRADVTEVRGALLASSGLTPRSALHSRPGISVPPPSIVAGGDLRLPDFRNPHRKVAVGVGLGGALGAFLANPDLWVAIGKALTGVHQP